MCIPTCTDCSFKSSWIKWKAEDLQRLYSFSVMICPEAQFVIQILVTLVCEMCHQGMTFRAICSFFFFFEGWENSIGAGHSDVSSPYLSAPAGPRGRHPGARQAEQVKKSYSHVFTCIQGSIEMQEKLFIYMHYSSSYTLLLVLIDCLI